MGDHEKQNRSSEKSFIEKCFIILGSIVLGLIAEIGVVNWLPKESYAVTAIIMIGVALIIIVAAIDSTVSSLESKICKGLNFCAFAILIFLVIIWIFHNKLPGLSAQMAFVSYKCFSGLSLPEYAKGAIGEAMNLNQEKYLYPAEAGRLYYGEKDYQQSIDYYSKAIELNPDLDRLYFERGRVYMQMQEPFFARDDFKKIVEKNPDEEESNSDKEESNPDEEESHSDDGKKNPDNEEYNYWLAKAYLECGYKSGENEDYKKAIEYFGKAIDVNQNNDEYYYQRARSYIEMGGSENNTNAVEDLTKAIDINDNNEEYYYQRGITYYNLGGYNDYTNSINDFTAAIKINDKIKEYYYWRGMSYFGRASLRENDNDELEDCQESINNFDIAIEIDQEYAECYNERAWSYHWSGNYKAGLMDMKQAVNLDGNNTDYRCNLGNFYYNGDEFKKAIKEYQIAIELEPNESCYFNLGDAYYKLKNYEEAIEAYTNALEYNESNVLYLSRRSLCYSLMGNYEKSRDDLKSIMQLQARGKEIF